MLIFYLACVPSKLFEHVSNFHFEVSQNIIFITFFKIEYLKLVFKLPTH